MARLEAQFKLDNTHSIIMALASSIPNHSYDAIKSHQVSSTYKRLVTELISTCRLVVSNILSSSISGFPHHTTPPNLPWLPILQVISISAYVPIIMLHNLHPKWCIPAHWTYIYIVLYFFPINETMTLVRNSTSWG